MIQEIDERSFDFFELDVSGELKPISTQNDGKETESRFGLHKNSKKHEIRLVVLRNHVPHTQALILVKSDHCPYCKLAKNYIKEVEKATDYKFPIYVIDTQKNPSMMQSLRVEFVPTYFFVTPDGIVDPEPQSFKDAEEIMDAIVAKSGLM